MARVIASSRLFEGNLFPVFKSNDDGRFGLGCDRSWIGRFERNSAGLQRLGLRSGPFRPRPGRSLNRPRVARTATKTVTVTVMASATNPQSRKWAGHRAGAELPAAVAVKSDTDRDLGRDSPSLSEGSGPRSRTNGIAASVSSVPSSGVSRAVAGSAVLPTDPGLVAAVEGEFRSLCTATVWSKPRSGWIAGPSRRR